MTYTTSSIANILHSPAPQHNISISILLTDSRSLTYPEQSLFFALRTPTGNGHRYIPELYAKGVRAFVVDHIPDTAASMPEAAWILTPDTLRALQQLARHHRSMFHIPVIGITGSRGKTTVKEWLYALLHNDYNIVRSPRSYNSQIGVPLSIWEMDTNTRLSIFEAGISTHKEMETLESIINPSIGIITNIGPEHNEGFSSIEEKCREKIQLLRHCECIIYCEDHKIVSQQIETDQISAKKINWSRINPNAPLFISAVTRKGNSSEIEYTYFGSRNTVTIPFVSETDIENAIHAIAVILYLNCPCNIIQTRMATLPKTGTRMDVMEGVNGCLVIHDSYTCDLHSLTPALDFMKRRSTTLRSCTVILSDAMVESLPPQKVYTDIARLLSTAGITRVIGIGHEISAHSKFFGPEASFYPTTSAFIESSAPNDFDNELILVKGAPEFDFQRICDFLELRRVETVLDVNLDAVVHNFNTFRAAVKPTTGIICMVKASGYGAGSYELAKTLQSQGAAYLAVAVLDEGVDLRRAGITMPIMVLNPRVVNYRMLFANNLEPEIYSFDILNEII
ncbi:MAG: alanine racemase, partial [Paramuribaculum sp.]|nr:alanine racemase [Paramuribaculum sp.]